MDQKKEQIEITERLQIKLLERWERLMDDKELSATDAATLSRVLIQNGWNIDPSALPEGLKDKVSKIDPKIFDFPMSEDEVWGEA